MVGDDKMTKPLWVERQNSNNHHRGLLIPCTPALETTTDTLRRLLHSSSFSLRNLCVGIMKELILRDIWYIHAANNKLAG